jgi:hypothetical protein
MTRGAVLPAVIAELALGRRMAGSKGERYLRYLFVFINQ